MSIYREPYREKRTKLDVFFFYFFSILIILAVIGFILYKTREVKPNVVTSFDNVAVVTEGEISFHFLELGNDSDGDCTFVKAGNNDILIDAGSTEGSVSTIKNYLDDFVTDGTLEYVIVTHADTDHIAGFAAEHGIFYYYDCLNIIDFPKTNKTTKTYNDYISNRNAEISDGANYYNALECVRELKGAKKNISLGDSIGMEILDNYYYDNDSSNENDYSVSVCFYHGERRFLFTGDLQENGEAKLVEMNDLKEVVLYKAGHHGSDTSSNELLLSKIKPTCCVVNCVAGGKKYDFPKQGFIDRIAVYTELVFVTRESGDKLLNGNVVVTSNVKGVSVTCSGSGKLLKDTEWFKKNRTTPRPWVVEV